MTKFNFNLVIKLRPTISTCGFFYTFLPLNKLCFYRFVNTNYSFANRFFLTYHKIHKLSITQQRCKTISPPLGQNCSSCVFYHGNRTPWKFSAIFLQKCLPLRNHPLFAISDLIVQFRTSIWIFQDEFLLPSLVIFSPPPFALCPGQTPSLSIVGTCTGITETTSM